MNLMEGQAAGAVGAPPLAVPAAQQPGVAPRGNGQVIGLTKFNPQNQSDQARIAKSPQVITATMIGSIIGGSGVVGLPGPLVGIITWGSGNGGNITAEFDIPSGTGLVNQQSGIILSVMGDYVQLAARNDSNVTPRDGDDPIGDPDLAMSAAASIALGPRGGDQPVTRTIYGVNNGVAGGLVGGDLVSMPVPCLARRFRVFRFDASAADVTVRQFALEYVDGPYTIAAGAPSPTFDLVGNAVFVEVRNAAGVGTSPIAVVGIVFELGF